ncbi:Cof-type HAD-IIB family hydrolase [Sphingomonas sp. BIUV-7]|uniref:Cof-type HAD-IIB family hydrolase n=1 Tax=Sphingomonas natans TaxID=3063330 RepID=A0ABT8Y9N5_9SPHN|nr:Cof-type HAD-IIB family hydrolase [Sphingomonas sp. BIUV-7]MDO6415051.1 Cof-type HAD-IIB family hydrolase [Sphingomonas sp. BIUV-7]
MSIRLVISDVDGTLVRSDKKLSPEVIAAVGRLQDAGVPFTLISARPASGMLWIADALKLTHPMGAFNGGTIVKPDGAIVSAEHIDPAVADKAIAMLVETKVALWLFAHGKWYAQDVANTHMDSERSSANAEPVMFRDASEVKGPFDKIVGVSDEHDFLADLDKKVSAALGDGATVARSQVYYLDVTAPLADKGHGIAALAKAHGLSLDEVAVLGDQRNDLPMFARAGFSVAMGQGPAEVRAAATRETRSNDEDGVAHAIDEILLPMIGAK